MSLDPATLAERVAQARAALAVLEREPEVDARGDVVLDVRAATARRLMQREAHVHLRTALEALDAAEAEVASLRCELARVSMMASLDMLAPKRRETTMTRPESDHDLTHDWQFDPTPEHPYYCPDCLLASRTPIGSLCPDRVKRALDRRFLAGVRAGLEAAAQVCCRLADSREPYAVHPEREAGILHGAARAIRAVDLNNLEKL